MKSELKSAGRPSFKIDPKRLYRLRESKRLTQEALIVLTYELMGKNINHKTSETLKTTYRRWEKEGRVTPQTAEALAKVLGVTVAVLQGAAPDAAPSHSEVLQDRIREQIAAGNEALTKMLDAEAAADRRAIHLSFGGSNASPPEPTEEHDSHIRSIASDLSARLERAQLSQDQAELNKLSHLLGYSLNELQQPISEYGHWLLVDHYKGSEIFQGIGMLISQVRMAMEEPLQNLSSDTCIEFQKENAWFRLKIIDPRWAAHPRLQMPMSFTRCQASETGLQWTQPTWRDELSLTDFEQGLCAHANYVKGLDGLEKGPADLRHLKLAIYQRPSPAEFEQQGWGAENKWVATTGGYLEELKAKGDLDELEHLEDRLAQRALEGDAHDMATHWLCSGLLHVLQPWLSEWPLQYWKFKAHGRGIGAELEAPLWLAQQRNNFDCLGTKYLIELVEELPEQGLRRVPWRAESVAAALARIQRDLQRELAPLEIGPAMPRYLAPQPQ